MNRQSKSTLLLAVVVAAAFLFGMVRLLLLRFEAGDVYAPYSTYRADPLGARGFYGALRALPEVSARRNLESIMELPDGRDTTLFFFGSNTSDDSEETIAALNQFAAEGGRLVVTFYPLRRDPRQNGEDASDAEADQNEEEPSPEDDGDPDEPWVPKRVNIADRWGFSFAYARLPGATDGAFGQTLAVKQAGPASLPPSVSWHTALYFTDCDEAWRTLYAWKGHAALIERPWLRGSIVLCSDSYFISNQAVRDERRPALLAWLVGPSSTVLFDETHLGSFEEPGVRTLIRKYRLDGLLAALVLLALLFVWQSASSLVPKREAAPRAEAASGRDAASGLVNLLRRSIPMRDIVPVCAAEWRRSSPKAASGPKQLRIQALVDQEQTAPLAQRNPVAAYKAICAILKEKSER